MNCFKTESHIEIIEWTSEQNDVIYIRASNVISRCLQFCTKRPVASQLITVGLADTISMIHAVLLIIYTGMPPLYLLSLRPQCAQQMSCVHVLFNYIQRHSFGTYIFEKQQYLQRGFYPTKINIKMQQRLFLWNNPKHRDWQDWHFIEHQIDK